MYRVVLIDDERLIVEGLSRVVKWADFGCEVAATAEMIDDLTEEGLSEEELEKKAETLVSYANKSGGSDNITVLLARF